MANKWFTVGRTKDGGIRIDLHNDDFALLLGCMLEDASLRGTERKLIAKGGHPVPLDEKRAWKAFDTQFSKHLMDFVNDRVMQQWKEQDIEDFGSGEDVDPLEAQAGGGGSDSLSGPAIRILR